MGLGEDIIAWAENLAIVMAAKIAIEKNWMVLWIESDSSTAVEAFNLNKLPQKLRSRWARCVRLLSSISVPYVGREVNIAADRATNFGRDLYLNEYFAESGRPQWMDIWEEPNVEYRRAVKP